MHLAVFPLLKKFALFSIPVLIVALVFSNWGDTTDSLQHVKDQGVLRVITRNSATTYYESQGNPAGFEYQLAKGFADHLGVELEMIPVVGLEDIFIQLEEGNADMAAAGLTITKERHNRLMFGPTYISIKQLFIYNRALGQRANEVEDLIGKRIRVMANSAHAELLRTLQVSHPALEWKESRDLETIDLLEQLVNGEIDFTLIDSNDFYANRAFYPDFRIAFSAGKPVPLAWAMVRQPANEPLRKEMEVYFEHLRDSGKLARLIDRHFTFSERQSFVSTHTFLQRMEQRLPEVKGMIEQVAIEYDMDWRLLAAISYQESHWEAEATSPTGVRGMMMLTQATADELGVDNRLDPMQSLRGGARYYRKLLSRLPAGIEQPDRGWFALAAYNIGLGHLEDARVLTQRAGQDPNLWKDVRTHLPLLRQAKWYKTTKYGFARGDEPVRYVENIRHYYSLLTWDELNRYRVPPPRIVADYLPDAINRGFYAL
ncbi:membrane-bound lytic murein transglycosylase MltF [Spongiibacter taiwanensis]